MTIYEFIDLHCKRMGISRAQLADRAGIPRSSLSMAFSRKSRIPADRLKRIAKVLNVPYKYFVMHSTDIELLFEEGGMREITDSLGLEQETAEHIILHGENSYTLNWMLQTHEFWILVERLADMIETADCDPVKNYQEWDYNCFLCCKDFFVLLKEARHEVDEYVLSAEDREAIEKALSGEGGTEETEEE